MQKSKIKGLSGKGEILWKHLRPEEFSVTMTEKEESLWITRHYTPR